jgi:two-component sensor histidine kinase
MFHESMDRIKTMAIIHEKLYQSKDLGRINFRDYINDITDTMFISYGLNSHKVKLKKDIEKITLGINTAIPCGLIINELVSNSLKYAFPEGREGEIRVALRMNDKEEVELTVSDNGVGMPEELDYKKTGSLGLNLVNALIMQLRGRIELHREQGTEFQIAFRRHE